MDYTHQNTTKTRWSFLFPSSGRARNKSPDAKTAVLHPRVAAWVIQEVQGARRNYTNPFTELSDREIEVIRPIVDGFSNAEIAEQLVISVKTVKCHVSNILGKIHLVDRTQAAVYPWQEGIVRRYS